MEASTALATASFSSPTAAPVLWTFKAAAWNATSAYLRIPRSREIVDLPLRGLAKLDNLIVRRIPNYLIQISGAEQWGNSIRSVVDTWLRPGAAAGAGMMADAMGPGAGQAAAQAGPARWTSLFADAFQASTFKSYFGMLHYLTSRWAFMCFSLALILNRVQIYASSRQRIFLTWEKRLALRLIPILLFTGQIYRLLQAIKCQSSPEYAVYRHGSIDKYSLLDWAPEGGFLHWLSSAILYSSSDEACCAAVGMSRSAPDVKAKYGSFSLLWPTFMRLCLSHLVETMSCHLQRLPVMTEVGMSVFEHSLAFAEAETMISHALGVGLFSTPQTSNHTAAANTPSIPASGTILKIHDATTALTGMHLLDRVNVPTEVLLVALLSCGNALSSHVISVANKQRSMRLVNTGFWGLCFMAAFIWGFFSKSTMVRVTPDGPSDELRTVSGLLHFPTVAIIGFLPHLAILFGMCICGVIYSVALLLTALSLGSNPNLRQPTSFWDRLVIAHENLQAAVQVRGIDIKWHEDFYTALLRIGFVALTAASEAVFLNEGRSVEMRQFTWLEEERLDEIESSRSLLAAVPDGSHFQIAEEYGLPPSSPGALDRGGKWESGYAKERKLEKEKERNSANSASIVYPNPGAGGVGALQRTARFYLLFIYTRGILYLIGGYLAFGLGGFLDRVGITRRPRWLRKIIGKSVKRSRRRPRASDTGQEKEMDFWFLQEDGKAAAPRDVNTDIEPEMRRRLALVHPEDQLEDVLDEKLYEWWKSNGWWGTKDESGDYQPADQEDVDDTTSIISMSTNASVADGTADEHAWESESDGRRTPTQRSPAPPSSLYSSRRSRSPTPFPDVHDTPLDPGTLARLLNPPDKASRDEARMLASHLSASASGGKIMTRSRYRHELETERARVLLAHRPRATVPSVSLYDSHATPSSHDEPRPLTPAEESSLLEHLILTRRRRLHTSIQSLAAAPSALPSALHAASTDPATATAAETMPMCVVCQVSPRTIIAWPCRCLCVCEECRVQLAMNNFGNCVTCRRGVGGFVRLWVP